MSLLFLFVFCQCDNRPAEPLQSTSVESIPEVLEDKESSTEQSDTASVHDIDYVNPRGVRFTQSTQRDGENGSFSFFLLFCLGFFLHQICLSPPLKFFHILSVLNCIELHGVLIPQRHRVPLMFNQLSQWNQPLVAWSWQCSGLITL